VQVVVMDSKLLLTVLLIGAVALVNGECREELQALA